MRHRTSECGEPSCNKKPQTDEASSGYHEATSLSPTDASLEVQSMLELSAEQFSVLHDELHLTTEDPVLVVQVNPAWVAIHGQVAADAVLDFIGEFEMDAGQRRDPVGARRFVYHFNMTADIGRCRKATALEFPFAFALSPLAVDLGFGAGGAGAIPLAFCAVIHKIGVHQDDVEDSEFFYA